MAAARPPKRPKSLPRLLPLQLHVITSIQTRPHAESSETFTFSHLKSLVIKLSNAFRHHLGLAKNDVILIFAPNFIYFPVCFLATISAGAISTTSNPLYTLSELSKQVKDSNPKLVVTVPELWDKVKPLNLPAVVIGAEGCSSRLQSSLRFVELHMN